MIHLCSKERGGVWLAIALNDNGKLLACSFSQRGKKEALNSVKESVPSKDFVIEKSNAKNSAMIQELYDLYEGRGTPNLNSIDLSHVSTFRREVYSVLNSIPRGQVTTYGAIAKKIASRRHARAVGTAIANNPLPLIIPCHRVVQSSLGVGNYGMPGQKPPEGGPVKHGLLEREGVKFQGDKVSRESLWFPR